jgi:hypothetical protein
VRRAPAPRRRGRDDQRQHAEPVRLRSSLTFRPVTDADQPPPARVYASTGAEEMAVTSMTGAQKAAFLSTRNSSCSMRITRSTIRNPTEEDKGVYDLMRWKSPRAGAAPPGAGG